MVSKMSPSSTPASPASPQPAGTANSPAAGAATGDKLCAVCGDKALGYNFNAVTCESCKAFFRRNALTQKPLQCPFSERCDITVVTRRFCQKCRLVKCFAIGMRKEYIMSEEDKALKKIKIEQNRSKRKPNGTSTAESSSPTSAAALDDRIRIPAKIKREVASLMRMHEEPESFGGSGGGGGGGGAGFPEYDCFDETALAAEALITQQVGPARSGVTTTVPDDDVQMAGDSTAPISPQQSPSGMSHVISSSSGESPDRSGGSRAAAAPTTPHSLAAAAMPTLASSSTAIVDRLVNYPEDSSKLINHLMRTPHDAVLVMTKIINSQKDAMRLIGHLIGAPGDALKIISKIMNSPFDALTVFTKFMSSPTDALEIIAKIASSPGEVLQFIQQLMNSPEDALQIMNKFMNSPAEALKMLNQMVNQPAAAAAGAGAAATATATADSTTARQLSAEMEATEAEKVTAAAECSHPMIKSMLNEAATAARTVTAPAAKSPTRTCEEALAQPAGSPGRTGSEIIREILEEAVDEPIAANTLEAVICEAISLEYELGARGSPGGQSNGGGASNSSRELNEAERSKLNELILANKALYAPLDEDLSGLDECSGEAVHNPQPQLLKIINLTAIAIRRLIKMSKKINAFRNMCQEDQVALLKGGCTEMMILRSAFQYDSTHAKWQVNTKVPNSQEALASITVDVLKLAKSNIYEVHESFIRTFEPKWRQDENIILLLSAIVLFTPDRPRAVHVDVLRLEQNSYYYLLRRYLESVYPGCEAKSTFLKLIQKIRDLQRLKDVFVGVYLDVNPNQVEPLLWEMFDLQSH